MSESVDTSLVDHIVEIDVSEEMRSSFLEYAYSVIYSRALPDARDGCKPVQRRILYQMSRMGLLPDRGHVKSQSVVGEVMGKLHPHGDSAIYDALVRLAQPFNLRLPLVDGHGNFGSLDDGPAAARYTEVRMAPAALDMVSDLDEDVVDFVANYDGRHHQPDVLPSAFPNLLVNGAAGIAVGMATNIAPHNVGEVIQAACYLLEHPHATTEELMRYVPGPDFPEGGIICGLDGVKEAYETGRGTFHMRAKVTVERVSARKQGLVVTELPYMVGPERVIERIKAAVQSKKLQGISGVTNLTDRHHGVRLVIEVKNGFNPQAVAEQLYRLTPLDETFSVNAVALVDGRPETLGLKGMLQVYLDHRLSVTRRRSEFRRQRAHERLHLVAGLLVAVLNIDDVIAIIRSSDDSNAARERLMLAFDLSQEQADHILSLRLRRLTKFSRLELETEDSELRQQIAELDELLASPSLLSRLVGDELKAVGDRLATPRRTLLLAAVGGESTAQKSAAVPLEIPDSPVTVVLTSRGGLITVTGDEPFTVGSQRGVWDTYRAALATTARATIGVVDERGMVHRLEVLELPATVRCGANVSLSAAVSVERLLPLAAPPVGLVSFDSLEVVGMVSVRGVVKRLRPEFAKSDSFPLISLAADDHLVAVGLCPDEADVVMISSDAQLLRTPAAKIRPQGRSASGVAGMSLNAGAKVIAAAFTCDRNAQVVTVAGGGEASLFGGGQSSAKVTALMAFPVKGRAGLGVRCQRFLKGEDHLELAAVTGATAIACGQSGQPVDLPSADPRRDGSGQSLPEPIVSVS